MFRIIPVFLLAVGAIICINSCDINMYGTYTFSHNITYVLQDNSDETVTADMEALINEYFSRYIDIEEEFTFTGNYSEAVQYGNNYLYELFYKFSSDEDYVSSLLQTDEYVQYILYMSGDSVYEPLGYFLWLPIEEDDEE